METNPFDYSRICHKMVWLIKIQCGPETRYATGFAIKENLIATCYHPFFHVQDPVLKIRRLDKDNKWLRVDNVYGNRHCDIAFLKANLKYRDNKVAKIPKFGRAQLCPGEVVTTITNNNYLLASGPIGYVPHPCNDFESLNIYDDTCVDGEFGDCDKPLKTCGRYKWGECSDGQRRMGNYWFKENLEMTEFEKNLDCRIAVFQIFNFSRCGDEGPPSYMSSAGSPIFNVKGKVVGIMRKSVDTHDCVVAIHCSVLRSLLDIFG